MAALVFGLVYYKFKWVVEVERSLASPSSTGNYLREALALFSSPGGNSQVQNWEEQSTFPGAASKLPFLCHIPTFPSCFQILALQANIDIHQKLRSWLRGGWSVKWGLKVPPGLAGSHFPEWSSAHSTTSATSCRNQVANLAMIAAR